MSINSFNEYSDELNDYYKKQTADIISNKKKSSSNMSKYVGYLTDNRDVTDKFKPPIATHIDMSKAPHDESLPLVICSNDSVERDVNGDKIMTKPFTWFVNNNNKFNKNTNNKNYSLIDNLIKNDSELYQDSFMRNILNSFNRCVYAADNDKQDNVDKMRAAIKNLNNEYRNNRITKEELITKKKELYRELPWITTAERDFLKETGDYAFKDGFSNYEPSKKTIGMTYLTSISLLLLFIIYKLK